jgi:hypothetical protein
LVTGHNEVTNALPRKLHKGSVDFTFRPGVQNNQVASDGVYGRLRLTKYPSAESEIGLTSKARMAALDTNRRPGPKAKLQGRRDAIEAAVPPIQQQVGVIDRVVGMQMRQKQGTDREQQDLPVGRLKCLLKSFAGTVTANQRGTPHHRPQVH